MLLVYELEGLKQQVIVDTIEDARDTYCQVRDHGGYGASELGEGQVIVDGKGIVRISYNGRLWPVTPSATPAPKQSDLWKTEGSSILDREEAPPTADEVKAMTAPFREEDYAKKAVEVGRIGSLRVTLWKPSRLWLIDLRRGNKILRRLWANDAVDAALKIEGLAESVVS